MDKSEEPTKTCTKCKVDKPLSEYHKRSDQKDGYNYTCKLCKNTESKARYAADPERAKTQAKKWRTENSERFSTNVRNWQKDNPERRAAYAKTLRTSLWRKIVDAYGGRCTCCGNDWLPYLQLDHVNDDGKAHRDELGIKGSSGAGNQFYRWLRDNGYPPVVQLLCASCHQIKTRGVDEKTINNRWSVYRHKLWFETITAYGSKCKCCGDTRLNCLQFDHVNDDGKDHRIKIGVRGSGIKFYNWLKKNGWPDLVQLLCANCHQAKTRKMPCHHS